MECYQKIVRGVDRTRFSYKKKDPDAADLVKNMLRPQPCERLPLRVGGVANLKGHSWYRHGGHAFNWERLQRGELAPPFVPRVDLDVGRLLEKVEQEREANPGKEIMTVPVSQYAHKAGAAKWWEGF